MLRQHSLEALKLYMRALQFGPLVALLASGCVGSVGPSAGGGPGGTPGVNPPGSPGNQPGNMQPGSPMQPGAGPPGDPPGACAAGAVPWLTTLLTREQYVHAGSELLGLDVRQLATFSDIGGRKATRGVSLTSLQVEERQQAAEAIAAAAAGPPNLARLVPCDVARPADAACIDRLVDGLGARAYRRPLTFDEKAALRKLFVAGQTDGGVAAGLEWLVAGLLQSPDFMYQLAAPVAGSAGQAVPVDDHALANRLAFFLWNSAPDAQLRSAAQAGQLRTAEGIRQAATRMLADPRARRVREDYHTAWLKLDDLTQVARDVTGFTPAVAQDLARSALEGVHHLYDNGGRVDALLTDAALFVNANLGKLYGLTAAGAAFERVTAKATERRGILTHPALLAFLSHPDASDPIKRGVFIQEEMLCQTIPDPLPDIPDLPPLKPGLSTRARLEQHRTDPSCSGCHRLFDPMGLALENYDPIGRYRDTDQGVPVDASGEVTLGGDLDGPFTKGMEFVERLSRSAAVRDCLAQRWFEYALSRAVDGADSCSLEVIRKDFRSQGDLIKLMGAIAQSDAFRFQAVSP
jgi:hypothetical protein